MDVESMSDDPFNDDDKTVLHSRGRSTPPDNNSRLPSDAETHKQSPTVNQEAPEPGSLSDIRESGINPLELAASRLLSILVTIKKASAHPSPTNLRNHIANEIESFRDRVQPLVDDSKTVTMASYVLCTALDEAALNTPWGHSSDWSQNSLLSSFHGEVRGGERFFELLKRLGAEPVKNLDLLELMYVCLALGYEGTYKIANNGQDTLTKIRKWLYEIISNTKPAATPALSEHWQGASLAERKLPRTTPLWVMLAVATAVAAVVYFALLTRLSEKAESAISAFLPLRAQQLAVIAAPPPAPLPPDPVARPTMTDLLPQPIAAGTLSVLESGDKALVRLVGDNLFGSGRADIDNSAVALLNEVANAINRYDGSVLITGHTDNIPIRKPEFPSNLDLSQARADSVKSILAAQVVDGQRMLAEGVGDLQPLNDNSTTTLRARNRRVEITVFY